MKPTVFHPLLCCALALFGGFSSAIFPAENAESLRRVVTVTNPTNAVWPAATVEIPWRDLRLHATTSVHVREGDRVLISQMLDDDGDGAMDFLLVQLDLAAQEVRTVNVTAGDPQPASVARVAARLVPERKNDLAWESDLIAFRIYHRDLEANDGPCSGIDVWGKKVPTLVTTSWYTRERGNYHKDRGEGCDAYSVKGGRGCGSSAIWHNDRLTPSRNFVSHRILANGPIRVLMEVTYEPWVVGDDTIGEVKRISLDAGQRFNVLRSTFSSAKGATTVPVAIGVQQHKDAHTTLRPLAGWAAVWDRAEGGNGMTGCAALLPVAQCERVIKQDQHAIIITTATISKPLTWIAGAVWDRSGAATNAEAWNAIVDLRATQLAHPLRVTIAP